MDKGKIHSLIGIVYQYDNLISVPDLGIKVQGSLLTQIFYNEDTDTLQFFAGDIVNDKMQKRFFQTKRKWK